MTDNNLASNELDGYITYKQENVEYLTGFTGSSGFLLVTPDDAVIFTDSRYMEQAKEQARAIDVLEQGQPYYKTINEYIKQKKLQAIGFESENVTVATFELWQKNLESSVIPCNDYVAQLRMIKDEHEIAITQTAVDLTDEAFAYVIERIRPGIKEIDIALELEFYLKKRGASSLAFSTIVASGKRSALPHGVASEKLIELGDMVTIDFGANYMGYCSDMTRSFIVGKASPKQKEIYNTVLTAQQKVLNNIKAGMMGKEVDEIARQYIYKQGYEGHFGHGLGHGLGKEVHEAPRLSPLSDTKLESGMLVTVEPGVYITDFGGVRIEDDIVITETGCRILNKTPKELLEIV
ncbi:M24 family metallopeptidase [Desulfuribacillus alkaliarsenatis]|uniref:Xaa-Pro dipeptidase n=1 Tax=Desulfuribacillus alkaliarsenatis TaxID=766136 RepID=A0A1E5G6G2_9FIRM|nr:Xaa-Pro dipeptidase [Desulfuribacillus alkaliarsenatis]